MQPVLLLPFFDPPLLQVGIALGGAAAVAFLPATATMVVGGATAGAAAGLAAFALTTPRPEAKMTALRDM